ncbi:glucosaminidase domain-containing protein [Chitinophagaceae bacterium LY-5]|uniref:Peptidoglycan hydrolase n=1 Tax=Polluticaenibacter yanchengensis TaxID=3014562 RepID=A0ABT4ULU9_9BACT|nr:glucosaminidase domain-containing protein [Chitinophagaceae bacterium LY-5]
MYQPTKKQNNTLFLFCSILATLFCNSLFAQQPLKVIDYIEKYKSIAIEEQKRTGVPAAITLAQGIHESGFGNGDLAKRSNNHFGIKCKATWTGAKVYHDDDEAQECFRAYDSEFESYRDHSDFLKNNQRYAFLFQLNPADYKGWSNGLRKAGYATNPRYPQILIKLIEDYNLNLHTMLALLNNNSTSDSLHYANLEAPAMPKDDSKVEVAGIASVSNTIKTTATNNAANTPAAKQQVETEAANQVFIPTLNIINGSKAVKITKGVTIYQIAKYYNTTQDKIYSYNDMTATSPVKVGDYIFIEPKQKRGIYRSYVVKLGDDVWSISQQMGIQLSHLLSLNKLASNAILKAGQTLLLAK